MGYKKNIKVTVNGLSIALGNGMNPNRPLNGRKINVRFLFVQYIIAVMY